MTDTIAIIAVFLVAFLAGVYAAHVAPTPEDTDVPIAWQQPAHYDQAWMKQYYGW